MAINRTQSTAITVIALTVIFGGFAAMIKYGPHAAAPAPLTAEQCDLGEQLAKVRRGDIVLDPTSTLCGRNTAAPSENTNTLIVTATNANGCFLKGIHSTLSTYFDFEELTRQNCRVIRYESEEWHDAMRAVYTMP